MTADLRIAWRNARQYRSRLASLSLLIVLGCVVSVVGVGFVAKAADSGSHRILSGVALRTIELSGGDAHPGATSLSSAHLDSIGAMAHVQSVEPSLQASFGVKTAEIPGAIFYGTIAMPSTPPPIVRAERPALFPLRDGEVVLPDANQGIDFSSQVGRSLEIQYTRQIAPNAGRPVNQTLRVVGLYSHTYTVDGPSAAYASSADVSTWAAARVGISSRDEYLAATGYQQASVIVDTAANLGSVEAQLAAGGYQATSVQQRLAELPRQLVLLKYLSVGVFFVLLIYCLVAGLSLAHSFVRQRVREIGLLKALGFSGRRIMRILVLELLLAGALPAVIGVGIGSVASLVIGYMLAGHTVFGVALSGGAALPSAGWIVALLLAPVLSVVVGGVLPARRSARLQPDIALRDWH